VNLIVMDADVASGTLRNRLPGLLTARPTWHTICLTLDTVDELAK
jgi:hypothetical protein